MSMLASLCCSSSHRAGDYGVLWGYASSAYDSSSGWRQKVSRVVRPACLTADNSCCRSRWFDDRCSGLLFGLENGYFLMTVFWSSICWQRGEARLSGLTPFGKNRDHFLGSVLGPLFFGNRFGCHFLGRAWLPLSGLSSVPGFRAWR